MSDLVGGERYEFCAGTSNKFWEWRIYDRTPALDPAVSKTWELVFRWGRRGTDGQRMSEWFDSKDLALWKARVRSREKVNKGYRVGAPMLQPKPLDRKAEAIGRRVLGLDKPRREVRRYAAPVPPEPKSDAPLVTTRRVKLG